MIQSTGCYIEAKIYLCFEFFFVLTDMYQGVCVFNYLHSEASFYNALTVIKDPHERESDIGSALHHSSR